MNTQRARTIPCIFCGQRFTRNTALLRHQELYHTCWNCMSNCTSLLTHHCPEIRGAGQDSTEYIHFQRVRSAFGAMDTYQLLPEQDFVSVESFLRFYLAEIKRLLAHALTTYRNIKFQITLKLLMREIFSSGEGSKWFNSNMHVLLNATSSEIMIVSCGNQIIAQINSFVLMGSSWTINRIESCVINIASYRPIRAAFRSIPLPTGISRRRGVASIPFESNCLMYCLIACYLRLTTKRQIETRSSYANFIRANRNNEIINFHELPSVASVHDLSAFLRRNSSFSANVFGYERGDVYPLLLTDNKKTHHADLLLYYDNNLAVGHFLILFNLSAFLNTYRGTFWFCFYCLSKFSTETERDDHCRYCKVYGNRKLEFMKAGTVEKPNPAVMSNRVPMVLYFDVETYTSLKVPEGNMESILKPCSFTYCLVSDTKLLEFGGYLGKDMEKVFVSKLIEIAGRYIPLMQTYKDIVIQTDAGKDRLSNNECFCCKRAFQTGEQKVLHHNHAALEGLIKSNNVS